MTEIQKRFLIFILIIFFGLFIGNYASSVEDARAGCARGNVTRDTSNETHYDLAAFLNLAAYAREQAGTPVDLRTAKGYRSIADRQKVSPLVDCADANNYNPFDTYHYPGPQDLDEDKVKQKMDMFAKIQG